MTATFATVSMPKLISTITLRVRFAGLAGARLWLAARVMVLAGYVAGVGSVEVEAESESDRRDHEAFRVRLAQNYQRAEAALIGGRWTRGDADRLIELINQGAATISADIETVRYRPLNGKATSVAGRR